MIEASNFIKTIIEQDLKNGKHKEIVTRFPPEPNGFLHIGHARAIVMDFELAKMFGGYTNLRYDDTNPEKEEELYVKAILEDVRWLGYEPKNIYFASDYFDEMFNRAVLLIKKGLAYVDHSSFEEMQKMRGSITEPGIESKYRNRSIDENLQLFYDMRDGKFQEGECVLRAKIDMSSPNMNMRDPVVYRINYTEHHNTKAKWVIYPMYDYAHPLEDAIEGITHSLCSLEFEDHRPLYDWFVEKTEMPKIPRQIEFGRLNIENTIMSKRHLRKLVEENKVIGWDDPRMPTLRGLRRRGYTPEAIKDFIISTGLSKVNSTISQEMLDAKLRDDLALHAKRAMAVINPLKVTITNYQEGKIEYLEAEYYPDDLINIRKMPFSRHIYIEETDFLEEKPNKKYKRLALGEEVRLMNAYFIKAYEVKKSEDGKIIEVLATYDEKTKSGTGFNERKPNGTIHFVEQSKALPATFNFFGPLILNDEFNENSWEIKKGFVEEALLNVNPQDKFQFLRNGYFNVDIDANNTNLIFNEIVPLKSSFK